MRPGEMGACYWIIGFIKKTESADPRITRQLRKPHGH
jgi:hypothetical protein